MENKVEKKESKKLNINIGNTKRNKDNKKIVILIVLIIAVVASVGMFLMISSASNKEQLEKKLTNMAKNFYEEYYYVEIRKSNEKPGELLSKWTEVGIKINLDNLDRYNNGEFSKEIKEEFKNNKTNKACNMKNTKAIIYPKTPYGKSDYEIKVELDCGFSKEK